MPRPRAAAAKRERRRTMSDMLDVASRLNEMGLTPSERRAERLAETMAYVNDREGSPNRGKGIYTLGDLCDRTGWPASMVRKALGELYGQGRVAPREVEGSSPGVVWAGTTPAERASL